jgi:RsiW-degrading membrane proteinase PrsW (M82 family)
MNTPLAIVFGVFPALVAIWIVDRMDRKRPEPPKLLRIVAFWGGVIVIPAGLLEKAIEPHGPSAPYEMALFMAFVVAAAVEEAAKLAVVRVTVWRRPEFDERMDGIVYTARAGLGFALVENVGYLLLYKEHLGTLLIVAGLRAVLSVPGHATWAGIMGYFAARKRFDGTGIGAFGGYLIAVAMHGAFDAALLCGVITYAFGHTTEAIVLLCMPIVIVAGGAIALRVLARRALAADDADVRLANQAPSIA